MCKSKISALILSLLLIIPASNLSASPLIKVALNNNPPLVFPNDSGEAAGFLVDVIKNIAERENWSIEFITCNWNECVQKIESEEIDLLLTLAFSEVRSRKFDYTQEPVFNNWAEVYRKPLTQIESISDLEGERIASSKGSIHTKALIDLMERFGINATILEVNSYLEVFNAIEDGRVTAGVVNKVNGIRYDKLFSAEKTSIIFNPVNLYFATAKGKNLAIRASIDKHLKRLKSDSSSIYHRLLTMWLSGLQDTMVYRPTSATTEKPVVFVGDMDFPPIESLEDGYPTGLNVEILHALSEVMKREFKINLLQWSTAQERVLTDEADALTLLGPTKKRKEKYDYTDTILNLEFTLFKRNDDLTIYNIQDIEGKVVGVTKGGYARQILEPNRKIKLHIIKNHLEGFELLKTGRIRAVATNKWVGSYILQKNKIDGIAVIEKPFAVNRTSIAVKKGNKALLEEINFGISLLKKNGTIEAIINRWSPKKVLYVTQEKIDAYQLTLVISILFILIAGIFTWTLTLRKQVRVKTAELEEESQSLVERTKELSNELNIRKRTEEKLRVSEERFSKAFEKSPLMMAIFRIEDGTCLDVNEKFLTETGYTREEIIGRTAVDLGLLTKEDREAIVERLSEDGIVKQLEITIKTKSGIDLICQFFSETINIAGEDRLVSTALDITEQKKAENELSESEKKYRELFESVEDGIIIRDFDGNIVHVNPAACRIFNSNKEQLLGMNVYDQVHPDYHDEVKNLFQDVRKGMTNKSEALESRPDGSTFLGAVTASPTDFNGEPHILVVLRDITERKQAEEALNRSSQLAAAGQMASGIAHEINNPLATISACAEVIEKESEAIKTDSSQSRKLHEYIKLISDEASRASGIIGDLLDFTRDKTSTTTEFKLCEMTKKTVHLFNVQSRYENYFFQLSFTEKLPMVEGDRNRIRQVIIILLTNAVESMPDGGVISVSCEEDSKEELVILKISDEGVGIAEEKQKEIFEPFYTSKREGTGTGLGLSIAQDIVEKHGGVIEVQSSPGKGSVFSVKFPLPKS